MSFNNNISENNRNPENLPWKACHQLEKLKVYNEVHQSFRNMYIVMCKTERHISISSKVYLVLVFF